MNVVWRRLHRSSWSCLLLILVSTSNMPSTSATTLRAASLVQSDCPDAIVNTGTMVNCRLMSPPERDDLEDWFEGEEGSKWRGDSDNCGSLEDKVLDMISPETGLFTTQFEGGEQARWYDWQGTDYLAMDDMHWNDGVTDNFPNIVRHDGAHEAAHAMGCSTEPSANAWADYCAGDFGQEEFDEDDLPPPPCPGM